MRIENCYLILPGHKVGFGDLEWADGQIARIDLRESPPTSSGASVSGARLVLPGLVNCHGHTAMTLVRGLGRGLPLQRWLEEAIFPVEAKMTPGDIRVGAEWGIFEMLAGGTTTVADMYDFPSETAAALQTAGMRGRICRVGLNFVPGRLGDCLAFTRDFNGGGSGAVRADLCIHSEYLTDEPFCRALAAANNATLRRPLHVHVSETENEHRACLARHGKTPIAYLADTGLLDCGGYAAHCVWCTDDDFRIMAAKNVSLVHNPSSNMKLGSGFARVVRARELGVNVALGTDGCASNDNLNLFEEMHLASLVHKGVAKDPTVLSAWDVIDMATVNGARALQMAEVGELAVGKAADFCVVSLDAPHLTPCLDIPSLIVHSMQASDVVETVIAGRIVYDRNRPDSFGAASASVAETKARFLDAVRRLGL